MYKCALPFFMQWNVLKYWLIIFSLCSWCRLTVSAQDNATQLALARQFSQAGEYDKSLPVYRQLYYKAPFDKSLYNEYLADLVAASSYDTALALTAYMQQIRPQDLTIKADRAYLLEQKNDKKQGEVVWEEVLSLGARDAYQIRLLADALQKRNQYDRAIRLYEEARRLSGNDMLFTQELALLYSSKGDKSKALAYTLDMAVQQLQPVEDVKNSLALIIGEDARLQQQLLKDLKKRMANHPQQSLLELWIWQSLRTGNIAQLTDEAARLDKEHGTDGYLMLQLGIMLDQNEIYAEALRVLEIAEGMNKTQNHQRDILLYKSSVLKKLIVQRKPIDRVQSEKLKRNYEVLFDKYPQLINTSAYLDYLHVRAIYLNETDSAVAILKNYILRPQLRKDVNSRAKLDLGDYYLIQGNQWEATLLYAQVDKAHKEDALGELAKFKNARLSYFFGEFDWAQQQLKILKAASSDMIANDALYLSVLITENTPPDSNYTPLVNFARADLLLFQYKTKEALDVLTAILEENPETPLADDILMAKAKIAMEEGRNTDAVVLLKDLYNGYKDDVLADDALLKLAELYEVPLNNPGEAVKYYELLVTEFPSSTYVQAARQKLKLLSSGKSPL